LGLFSNDAPPLPAAWLIEALSLWTNEKVDSIVILAAVVVIGVRFNTDCF
jgi:hypothetical protein